MARGWELFNLESNLANWQEERGNIEIKKSVAEFGEGNVLIQQTEDKGNMVKNLESQIAECSEI